MVTFGVGMGALLALPFLVLAASPSDAFHDPTTAATDDIPLAYLAVYQDAAATRCPSLPWSVLAGIGKVESDHGRLDDGRLQADGSVQPAIIGPPLNGTNGTSRISDTEAGRYDKDAVYDRAVGPMQFLPTTWVRFGVDASGDGRADPHNAIDAIHAAGAYLCAHGANDPARLRDAIWAYNHSWDYVDRVLFHAARYGAPGIEGSPPSPELISVVLANPRLKIYEAGRQDIAAGRIDARVLTVLQLASAQHALVVSSLKTGHSRCVGGGDHEGCTVSHHWHGRAVDISTVDRQAVSNRNLAARHLASWLAGLPPPLRPDEVGSPWTDLVGPGYFSDAAHADHLHSGWRSKRE